MILITCAETREFNAIGCQPTDIPGDGGLPKTVPPSRRKKWRKSTLMGLPTATQWASKSIPDVSPPNLVSQAFRQQVTLETTKK
ncbi:hypothetical protein NL676_015194 [Syzygium grande]|nr:hypothetical protein NL676_015194 [Syzygium grande]